MVTLRKPNGGSQSVWIVDLPTSVDEVRLRVVDPQLHERMTAMGRQSDRDHFGHAKVLDCCDTRVDIGADLTERALIDDIDESDIDVRPPLGWPPSGLILIEGIDHLDERTCIQHLAHMLAAPVVVIDDRDPQFSHGSAAYVLRFSAVLCRSRTA